MRIGIDAHMVGHRETGNETYILELVKALVTLKTPLPPELVIFVEPLGRSQLPAILENTAGVSVVDLPTTSAVRRLAWDWPRLARRYRLDLLHLTYNAPLFSPCPLVVTVHDISFERHPEWFSQRDLTVLKTLVPRSVRKAARVITAAEFTRRELAAIYPTLEKTKIKVTPYAVGDNFRPVTDESRLARVREKYGTSPDFVLAVGNLQPRKNLMGLLEGFEQAVRTSNLPHKLVIAGQAGWQAEQFLNTVREKGLAERVVFTGFVPGEDLPALYSAARLFAYPSLYEGFGFPVLEAMACGTPVLTSNNTVLPEVAGEAACLVDARNSVQIGEALVRLLTNSEERARLSARGLDRATSFSWTKTALETFHIYEEVCAEKAEQTKVGRWPGLGLGKITKRPESESE